MNHETFGQAILLAVSKEITKHVGVAFAQILQETAVDELL